MRNKRTLVFLAGLICWLLIPAAQHAAPVAVPIRGERRIPFNDGWRFFKGEISGAEQPAFDDSSWRAVRLPHDWAIEGPFDPRFGASTGGLPVSGTGWYRKSFTLPVSAKGRYFTVQFDGAMSNSRVWVNGQDVGGRPYGYSSFSIDITPFLQFGGKPNVIAVGLTPEERASRWYPGAGIYRNVWLDVTGPVQVSTWGTYITTPEVTAGTSTVLVKTDLRNRLSQAARIILRTSILDAAGKQVARNDEPAQLPAMTVRTVETKLTVAQPHLWDVDHPYLYRAVTEVLDGRNVVDRYETSFGIRSIAFSKEDGFQLNGRTLKFQGVCLHSDLGALGMAVNRRAIERELQILKAAGVNAIRTSHNPPAPELLEYADRLGFLVIDEAYDMWRIPKVPNGSAKFFDEWSERDIRDLARRDRNHPSVIMWSIGNEVPEQGRADGWEIARRLTGLFHEEDPTRPTTAAFDNWQNAIKNKLADQVDIQGFNYKPNHYEEILRDHPNWMIYGSETASTVSSRGVYHLPLQNYRKHESKQVTSYDVVAPSWAMPPDVEFYYQDRLPKRLLGEFVWTGFDYLGEPTPYSRGRGGTDADWPSRSSYFGMVDLAGFPKDRYYLYQSRWTTKSMVHLLPHWNWAGREGQSIPVMAYSNGDEVGLFLNGRSLGREKRFGEEFVLPVGRNVSEDLKFATKYRFVWQVPYEPGVLKAVAYRNGKPVSADEIHTAGPPAKIELASDRKTIRADGDDLSFVTVKIEDKNGFLCPLADNLIHFDVTGAAEIAAVDNGNAATVEPFQAHQRKAFNGLALVILRSKAGQPARVRLTASSAGLTGAKVEITTVRESPN